MHPHEQRFGVRVAGVRDAAPAGPQDGFSRRMGALVGGKFRAIGGGDGTAVADPPSYDEIITAQTEIRSAAKGRFDAILSTARSRPDGEQDLTADEQAAFTVALAEYRSADDRILEVREIARREQASLEVTKLVRVNAVREPMTYQKGHGPSYALDLGRVTAGIGDVDGSRERLIRHAKEMDVELPKRLAAREQKAAEEARGYSPHVSPFEKRVNPNRTDGQGGYFVPPLWLIDDYVLLARAGRVFANSVRNLTLPDGTDSINIPKIATGTTAAIQTADAAGVSSTDLTDSVATAGVKTIAGQQDIALQLLEQSPIGFDDQVIFPDLIADYNMKLDQQCLVGSNASGQVQGINGLSGTNGVTYTDATPTGPELYVGLAQALSLIAGNRYMPAEEYVMHPRRWYWLASQLDANGRPLVVPTNSTPYNAEGIFVPNAEGPAGFILGTPVLLDANVPATQGAGTNEDRIYAVKASDLLLWEGALRARALTEVLSGTLQVRLQVYNYVAFMPDRYAKAISVISGTGLAAPAGF